MTYDWGREICVIVNSNGTTEYIEMMEDPVFEANVPSFWEAWRFMKGRADEGASRGSSLGA